MRGTVWSGELRSVAAEANAEVQAALANDDRDPWVHLTQGILFNRLRYFAEASRALRRALELNPNFALAHSRTADDHPLGSVDQRHPVGSPSRIRRRVRSRSGAWDLLLSTMRVDEPAGD